MCTKWPNALSREVDVVVWKKPNSLHDCQIHCRIELCPSKETLIRGAIMSAAQLDWRQRCEKGADWFVSSDITAAMAGAPAGAGAPALLELYCGCGNHTVALAPLFAAVEAVELNQRLVDAARQTSVERRILPWADIPIELGGEDVPLAVFEGDDPSQVRLAPAPRPPAAVD